MLISLLLGYLAGIIMHRSDYCIAGMFRDLFLFKHTFMLRTLVLLVVSNIILFELARQSGLVLYPFPPTGSPSLSAVIGGALFGIGMILAGGCPTATLYKMGSGNFLSLIAFTGIISGCLLYAEIHPYCAAFIKQTTFFQGRITIPQMLGADPLIVISATAAAGGFFIIRWLRDGKLVRPSNAEGYFQPWKAAVCLAFIGVVAYVVVGKPIGVTNGYAKLGAYIEGIFFRGHVEGLPFFKATPINYMHPLTNIHMQGGSGPWFDAVSVMELPIIIGIVFGSACSAVLLREFRIYYNVPYRQYISAFTGGVLMGLSARLSLGCNVTHLLGGLPILTGQSILFLAGLVPGAWLGSKMLVHMVLKNDEEIGKGEVHI
ncbi:MAG: hypothetical protein CVV37_06745 [Nitrospira bacterium HGW-Nitrospira-1]|nr:MAG: hypothetical protein CVV37_06745 [Nitrospira bacterium HGW-Nitrospira-1]